MNDNSTLTLRQAIEKFQHANKGMLADRTVQYHLDAQTYLLKFIGRDIRLDDITLEMLINWRAELFEKRLSKFTIDSYIRSVKRLFNWLNETELYSGNIAKKLKPPKLPECDPKALELADLQRVLSHMAYLERYGRDMAATLKRDRAMILFLADTGCRVGGICSLNLDSIDFDAGRAIVAEKGRGGKKRRLVFISEKTAAAVKDWLHYHPHVIEGKDQSDTALFVSFDNRAHGMSGERLKENGVHQALERRGKAAGVKGRFNPHSFRHAAAREWIRNGADLSTVSQLLGHTNIEVTAIHYARWATEELKHAHTKFGFIGGNNE